MTKKKKDAALAHPVAPTAWQKQREAERIVPTEIPHLNSTMGGRYDGKELSYRGRK